MGIVLRAPAKVNLYLNVVGRRADGYHEIETLFLPVPGLHDTLEVSLADAPGIHLTCDRPDLPCDERNTCRRAAAAFSRHLGSEPRWQIHLQKRIPVAAGLGGGSSDAAQVLLACNRLLGETLTDPELRSLATGIGADVPFFLNPRPAVAGGIGDLVAPVDSGMRAGLVVLNPGFPLPVAWSYAHAQWRDRGPVPSLGRLVHDLGKGCTEAVAHRSFSALEAAVFRKFPLVEIMRDFLLQEGCLCAHVSGSGPSVFGLSRYAGPTGDWGRLTAERFGSAVYCHSEHLEPTHTPRQPDESPCGIPVSGTPDIVE
jgi:4-diphosphocytidyl-2-C-methyl-D-erythritol kinase